jgi:diguanylate cyclase
LAARFSEPFGTELTMTARPGEHDRTVTFGELALGQIKALGQSAAPRNYEIWYHYASGYNAALNDVINEKLSTDGGFSNEDVEKIHARFFAPARVGDRLDSIGSKVMDKIDQIMSVLDNAVGSTSKHTESLADMTNRLGAAEDGAAIRTIIEGLLHTVKDMEENNKTLESRLTASRVEITQLQHSLETVRSESLTDPLTTLANRKCFDEALARAVAQAQQRGAALSLIMTDIDHFKRFNDTYGHLTGDQVLRLVALALKQSVRGGDVAARYGGEEFALILPDMPLRPATSVADDIRRAVMGKELMKRSTRELLGRVTISVGVATLHSGDTATSLIERTDGCLYAAKRNGRNQVVCETDPDVSPVVEMQVA